MADQLTRQSGLRASRRLARRALLLGATLLVAASGSGCTALTNALDYHDGMNEWMIGYRNRAMSAKAWHREKRRHCRRDHLHDFCNGFRQGYEDVADGGNGCTPSFPPREYWGWKYQSATGQSQVAAWFAGYPLGAKAAEEDGVGYFSQIQTSVGSQQEYLQHGKLEYAESEPVPMSPELIEPGQGELLPEGESVIELPGPMAPPPAAAAPGRGPASTAGVPTPGAPSLPAISGRAAPTD